jgi:hypothetical protein
MEDGSGGVTVPEFGENRMDWGFTDKEKNVEIRFKETIDNDGNWVETGEAKPAGMDKWFPFFYMILKRIR